MNNPKLPGFKGDTSITSAFCNVIVAATAVGRVSDILKPTQAKHRQALALVEHIAQLEDETNFSASDDVIKLISNTATHVPIENLDRAILQLRWVESAMSGLSRLLKLESAIQENIERFALHEKLALSYATNQLSNILKHNATNANALHSATITDKDLSSVLRQAEYGIELAIKTLNDPNQSISDTVLTLHNTVKIAYDKLAQMSDPNFTTPSHKHTLLAEIRHYDSGLGDDAFEMNDDDKAEI